MDVEDALRAARLVTGRYQSWTPSDGVPVRITVGAPKFWRGPRLADGRALAPWGLLHADLPTAEVRERYEKRLDEQADEVVAVLARLAVEHPGERLVLCCYEDVAAGQECHRRWLAEWLADRYGLDVPELTDEQQPRLFPS